MVSFTLTLGLAAATKPGMQGATPTIHYEKGLALAERKWIA